MATRSLLRTGGVQCVFFHLADIPNLGNSILQGKAQRSMRTTAQRCFQYRHLGVWGLFRRGQAMGLAARNQRDFGQTLGYRRCSRDPTWYCFLAIVAA